MSAPAGWLPGARDIGFTPVPGGEHLHRIGMNLSADGGWATLTHPTFGAEGDPAARQLGGPGFWRRFAADRAEFDFPPCEVLGVDLPFERLLDWALTTADGAVPRVWRSPPRDEVLAAVGERDLLARSGNLVVRGEIVHTRTRLSIAYPEFLRLPGDLSPARRTWVAALLDDAQQRWRLVRLGPDASGRALRAEVDLTGAPHEVVGALLGLAATALSTVLPWALPALRLAADPEVSSEILDTPPTAGRSRGKD